jgi:hypothetical protein
MCPTFGDVPAETAYVFECCAAWSLAEEQAAAKD